MYTKSRNLAPRVFQPIFFIIIYYLFSFSAEWKKNEQHNVRLAYFITHKYVFYICDKIFLQSYVASTDKTGFLTFISIYFTRNTLKLMAKWRFFVVFYFKTWVLSVLMVLFNFEKNFLYFYQLIDTCHS